MKYYTIVVICLLAGMLFVGHPHLQQEPPNIYSPTSKERHPKLDSALSLMVSHADQAYPESEDQVQVTLELYTPADSNEPIVNVVNKVGGQVQTYAGSQVQALVPVSALSDLTAVPSINYIHVPNRPYPDAISEGVTAINADTFRLDYGTDGAGVKIGILDQGFAGYPALQSSGELPAALTAQSFRSDGEVDGITDHGTACAEIVYDIAPGAAYYFVTYDTDTEFVAAVAYLEAEGVHIISHSLSFFNLGPYDGTSAVSARIDLARMNGIFWVNSAGDYARRHWEGMYDGDDQNILHLWDGVGETVNSIGFLEGPEEIEVYLSWNDWPTSNNNYDLYLMFDDGDGWDFVKYSDTVQSGFEPPVEMITHTTTLAAEYGFTIYNDQSFSRQPMTWLITSLPAAYPMLETQLRHSLLVRFQSPIMPLTACVGTAALVPLIRPEGAYQIMPAAVVRNLISLPRMVSPRRQKPNSRALLRAHPMQQVPPRCMLLAIWPSLVSCLIQIRSRSIWNPALIAHSIGEWILMVKRTMNSGRVDFICAKSRR